MDECIQRRSKLNGAIQLPVAFITCNSSPPTKNSPAFFTHYDVETLFHEFGHGLQHMLTKVRLRRYIWYIWSRVGRC